MPLTPFVVEQDGRSERDFLMTAAEAKAFGLTDKVITFRAGAKR